jgi:uncharacterized membrane protein YhaH (DUF805 family)
MGATIMTFGEAINSGFRNYVTFNGRAVRSEYWYWVLFATLVALVAGVIDSALFRNTVEDAGPVDAITSLVLFLPGLAVSACRLHDIGRTAWWLLIILTIVGGILLIVWACFKGTDGPNRFGADPLAGT